MTLVRSAIRQGGTWHPHHGGATIWMTGKKHVTPDGGVIYPKTLYPKRYYKFGTRIFEFLNRFWLFSFSNFFYF